MRGADAIIAARLQGHRLARIDVDVLPARRESRDRWQPPGVEVLGRSVVGRIEVYGDDTAAALDLRCCHGLPVMVLAESYEAGWPVAARVLEAEPARLHFGALDYCATYTPEEGIREWAL